MELTENKTLSNLYMMQHCDSFFPTGAVSFSWGLEALVNLRLVNDSRETNEFIISQVKSRWANFDLPVLDYCSRGKHMSEILYADQLVEAQSLPKEQRQGSKKLGAAMLKTHQKLNTPGSDIFSDEIAKKHAFGHLSVVQGYIWQKLGFSSSQIKLMSAHCLCTGILGSAVRLSVIGFLDAQKLHTALQPIIQKLIDSPVADIEKTNSFLPIIDIASMKHETDDRRMFMN